MNTELIAFWKVWLMVMVILRFITVLISSRNEKKLKDLGACEYGKFNSVLLIIMHFTFYFACFIEGYKHDRVVDYVTIFGLVLFTISIILLYYIIYELKHIWTFKLIIAPRQYHTINKSFLFKYVRHPNYYLNVIPELIAFSLIFHAWYSLAVIFPINLILLVTRIRQEEKIMRLSFDNY